MRRWYGLAAVCCALVGGCAKPQPFVTAERELRGLVIVLPGIEGRGTLNETICKGLNEGGVNWSIELYDWTTGVPGNYLYHLRARKRNHAQAAALARRIRRHNTRHPGRPVVLVAQSGGAAIAAWAAEAMDSARGLTGVVMLAPALSPGYDLRAALANTERGIVSFYSPRDWVFLGMGTSMWGTMDGKHSSSAGRRSFDAPAAPQAGSPYAKLFQLSWNREMSDVGYAGGHLSSGAEVFVARYVAPLIPAEEWNEALMVRVLTQDWTETPRLPPPEQWRLEPVPTNGPTGKARAPARPPARPAPARRRPVLDPEALGRRAPATKPSPRATVPQRGKGASTPRSARPKRRRTPPAMYVSGRHPILVRDAPPARAPAAGNVPRWDSLTEPLEPAKPPVRTVAADPVPRWERLADDN